MCMGLFCCWSDSLKPKGMNDLVNFLISSLSILLCWKNKWPFVQQGTFTQGIKQYFNSSCLDQKRNTLEVLISQKEAQIQRQFIRWTNWSSRRCSLPLPVPLPVPLPAPLPLLLPFVQSMSTLPYKKQLISGQGNKSWRWITKETFPLRKSLSITEEERVSTLWTYFCVIIPFALWYCPGFYDWGGKALSIFISRELGDRKVVH